MKLSVVLATFNEEENIAKCLESVKDIADEIVVVDGTSKDRTVEIAEKFNAKVTVTTNPQNFHINKQKAIDKAKGEWILQMDADEVLSEGLKEEIKEVINDKKSKNGYWMPRKNWYLGRFLMKGGQYPDYTLRLYKRGKGKLPQKDVHEQAEVEGEVGYLKKALLHYPYKNFRTYLRKWNGYNNFFAHQIKYEQSKKNVIHKFFSFFNYLIILPLYWFLITTFRHKGILDSWQGILFSKFSALRYPVSYLKYLGLFRITIFLIFLIGLFLRFYDFSGRWGLGGDDGRDVMIALEAIKRREIPLIGSFSSAGPFVFGPIFYWFIMLSYLILPVSYSPWLFLAIVSSLTVLIFTYLGYVIGGKKLAIVASIFAAISPQLVIRGLLLGQHSFVATFSALTVLFFILIWKKKKIVYALLAGLSLGIAFNMHYQAINLLLFIPAVFFLNSITLKKRFYCFLLILLGFLFPYLPLLIWDYPQNFANIRNLMDYFLVGQYRIYVPNSWKLYLFNYFPHYWSFVIGRYELAAIFIQMLVVLAIILAFIKRKLSNPMAIMTIIFFILFFVNRFYRGERSEGYLLYFAPLIIIFSSWALCKLFFENKNKILKTLGVLLILFIVISNLITIRNTITIGSPVASTKTSVDDIAKKFPNQKFAIYDYKYKMYVVSMAFSFLMQEKGLADVNGRPIGIGCEGGIWGNDCPKGYPVLSNKNLLILDLTREEIKNHDKTWVKINQENVYDDLIGWSKKRELKSNFSLIKYITNK